MKKIFAFVIIIFLNSGIYAQDNFDVLHYRFELLLRDETDSIKGTATIQVLFLQETNLLSLDLSTVSEKKGMSVFSVVDSTDENKMLASQHRSGKLQITFPNRIKKGEIKSVIIRYHGIPADGLIISKNKFGNRTFFSDNWPNRAQHWLPCKDDPADKASVDFHITAPGHYQVISNGMQVEETNLPGGMKLTHYKEELPLPTKIMVIGVAEFAVGQAGIVNDCIPVTSWVFPENRYDGFEDYKVASEILKFYINYIGPYPYKKLANVQSKTIFGGMENASAIFYSENSVTGKRDQEALIAHEIVHQWFGNMATEKSFAHIWLSEGFATYLTHLYLESKYGIDSLAKRMQKDKEEIIGFVKTNPRPVVDNNPDFMGLLNENSYQKGGWVLHMLRRQLGDSIFQQAIRRYFELYKGKNADTKDFQQVFESVSGKKLNSFFAQWLHLPENPNLSITWRYDVSKKQVNLEIRQLQKNLFDLPLKIGLVTSSGTVTYFDAKINQATHKLTLPSPGKSQRLIVDPFVSVLVETSIKQSQ